MKQVEERYISLLTDFGFKRIFGTAMNKDLLICFLNSLFNGRQVVKDVSYLNPEHVGDVYTDRKAIFDVYCEGENGEKFIVEMQNAYQTYFKDRSLFYSTFPIREQAPKGNDWNFKLNYVYTVALLNFNMNEDAFDKEKIRHHVQLCDTATHKVFYDKLEFIYVEIAKFNKTLEELETLYDKWLYALKNLYKLTQRPKELCDKVFDRLFEEAEIAKFAAGRELAIWRAEPEAAAQGLPAVELQRCLHVLCLRFLPAYSRVAQVQRSLGCDLGVAPVDFDARVSLAGCEVEWHECRRPRLHPFAERRQRVLRGERRLSAGARQGVRAGKAQGLFAAEQHVPLAAYAVAVEPHAGVQIGRRPRGIETDGVGFDRKIGAQAAWRSGELLKADSRRAECESVPSVFALEFFAACYALHGEAMQQIGRRLGLSRCCHLPSGSGENERQSAGQR